MHINKISYKTTNYKFQRKRQIQIQQSAQKVNLRINLTRTTLQKHFNEIPELHSKATIPPVVK